jgi:hypothetical protein
LPVSALVFAVSPGATAFNRQPGNGQRIAKAGMVSMENAVFQAVRFPAFSGIV